MKARTGQIEIAAVSITCPHCLECIEEPKSGSLMFEEDDLMKLPEFIKCNNCDMWFFRLAWPKRRTAKVK